MSGHAFRQDSLRQGRTGRPASTVSERCCRHPPLRRNDGPIDPRSDLSYILYTGGTTGFPEGRPGHPHRHDLLRERRHRRRGGEHLMEGGDTYIAVNPLFHIMALGLFMAVGLNKGNTVMLDAGAAGGRHSGDASQRHRVRWMLGVPALYRMILENDRFDRYDLSSLKYCFCGGDVLPEEVKQRWRERCGIPIYQVYGSTEVGHVAYSRIGEEPSPSAIGFPLKSRECLVVDPGDPRRRWPREKAGSCWSPRLTR
ncbi:MAG: long-chain fatty acid--CoA ligase [Desulfomicrobium escambiense]|nr:long-chain fatty acid--CoA ligase [Desulfomicrobium escambiense]